MAKRLKAQSVYGEIDRQRFLSRKEYIGTASAAVGNSFKNTFMANYGTLIASRFLGLSIETFKILTTITLALSIWDIINDILVGNIIDRRKVNSRHGRFKPIIFITAIPCLFIAILQWLPIGVWNEGLSQTFKLCYVVVLYLLNDMFSTFYNAASNGILARMTPSNRERGIVQAMNSFISSPLGSTASIFIIIIPKLFSSMPEPTQYFMGATLLSLIGTPLALYLFVVAKERIVVDEEKPPKLREVYRDVLHNRPMMCIIISELIACGFGFTGFAYVYLCRDVLSGITFNLLGNSIVTNEGNIMLFVSCLCIPPTLLSIVAAPFVRKYVDDKKIMICTRLFSALCYLTMFILCVPASNFEPKQLFWRIVIPYSIHGFTTGFYNIMPNLMMYDALDYGEWKTGKRTEATVYAVKGMMSRIGAAFVTFLGGQLLVRMSYPTDDYTKLLNATQQDGIVRMFTLIPGLFCVLTCIPLLFYNYIGKYKLRIEAELQEKRQAIQAEREMAAATDGEDIGEAV